MKKVKIIYRILLALGIMVVLQVADYFITNASYPLLDSLDSVMVYDYFTKNHRPEDDDILYLDVAHDKKLVPAIDEWGDTIGVTPITNRKILADFLQLIKDEPYRHIFLDIRFEEGTECEDDSLLFATLSRMRDLNFSNHRGIETFVPDSLLNKSGYSDYRGNFRDGFTRYEIIQDNKPSSALKIYSDLDSSYIKKSGPLYFDNGKLSYNMIFVPLYLNDTRHEGIKGEEKFHYLGFRMKNMPEELKEMAKDRIIVIGDFENDTHQTYIGDVPGPLLTVRAYQAMHKGIHHFSWVCFSIISAIYFLILFFLLGNYDLNDKICKLLRIKSKTLVFILSFIGWGFILGTVKLTLYAIFGFAFVAWLPALIFSSISMINEYRKT